MESEDEILIYLTEFKDLLIRFEESIREKKLGQYYWEKITPINIHLVTLHLFTKITQLLSTHSSLCNLQYHRNTSSSSSLCHDHFQENVSPFNVQLEEEEQLKHAEHLQQILCPLLIRFWQTIPTQLRTKVKSHVVQNLQQSIHSKIDSTKNRNSKQSTKIANDYEFQQNPSFHNLQYDRIPEAPTLDPMVNACFEENDPYQQVSELHESGEAQFRFIAHSVEALSET